MVYYSLSLWTHENKVHTVYLIWQQVAGEFEHTPVEIKISGKSIAVTSEVQTFGSTLIIGSNSGLILRDGKTGMPTISNFGPCDFFEHLGDKSLLIKSAVIRDGLYALNNKGDVALLAQDETGRLVKVKSWVGALQGHHPLSDIQFREYPSLLGNWTLSADDDDVLIQVSDFVATSKSTETMFLCSLGDLVHTNSRTTGCDKFRGNWTSAPECLRGDES